MRDSLLDAPIPGAYEVGATVSPNEKRSGVIAHEPRRPGLRTISADRLSTYAALAAASAIFVITGIVASSSNMRFDLSNTHVEGGAVAIRQKVDLLQEEFCSLRDEWLSDPFAQMMGVPDTLHPAFRRIVGMGEAAIPLLIQELDLKTGHWDMALREITGEYPVPEADWGNLSRIASQWHLWAKARGYVS